MIGFRVFTPPDETSKQVLIRFAEELIGFEDIVEKNEGEYVLCFEDEESARTAQWLLELNGAKGR